LKTYNAVALAVGLARWTPDGLALAVLTGLAMWTLLAASAAVLLVGLCVLQSNSTMCMMNLSFLQ
jgi:hypothetical protein